MKQKNTGKFREALCDALGYRPGDLSDDELIENFREKFLPKEKVDGREPKECPKCGQTCVYGGWDHVHPDGLGIGSCLDCPFCEKFLTYPFVSVPEILSFEPLNPVVPGHMLFVPIQHVADIGSNAEVASRVMKEVSVYARRVGDCNVITSRGVDATQTVFHFHVHVVPRRAGDGLKLPWSVDTSDVFTQAALALEGLG